jgi:AbiV family abortive infection protein
MQITEQLWNELKKNILSGVIRLLESADILLSNDGDVAICAGLYTYAVEEYGKLILLTGYIPKNAKVDIDSNLFSGKKSHDLKFEAALKRLPDECKNIGVSIWAKGMWPKGMWPDESSVVADFESRLAIFYCDLNASKKVIKPVPLVGRKSLETAIEKLKTIAFGFNIT